MAERIRVLMAEDNPDHVELCREFLPSNEFFLDAAKNGKEALQKARTSKYDIIVLDYRLPDVTGAQLLKDIRAFEKDTPIIFVTAMDDPDISFQVLKNGASDYVPKTFQYYEMLKERILENLHAHKEKA
jgi:DNA-binding response OmpR family regulator